MHQNPPDTGSTSPLAEGSENVFAAVPIATATVAAQPSAGVASALFATSPETEVVPRRGSLWRLSAARSWLWGRGRALALALAVPAVLGMSVVVTGPADHERDADGPVLKLGSPVPERLGAGHSAVPQKRLRRRRGPTAVSPAPRRRTGRRRAARTSAAATETATPAVAPPPPAPPAALPPVASPPALAPQPGAGARPLPVPAGAPPEFL